MRPELEDRVNTIPLYQETEVEPVWDILEGNKDDVFVYDRCGRLTYFVPLPLSLLNRPYVGAAIFKTYYSDPCGPCDISSNDTLSETHSVTPTDGARNFAMNDTENEVQSQRERSHHHGHSAKKSHFHHRKYNSSQDFESRNSSRDGFRSFHQERPHHTKVYNHHLGSNSSRYHHHHHHHHHHHYHNHFQNRTRHRFRAGGFHGNGTRYHHRQLKDPSYRNRTTMNHAKHSRTHRVNVSSGELDSNQNSRSTLHSSESVGATHVIDVVENSTEGTGSKRRNRARYPNRFGQGRRWRAKEENATEPRRRRDFYGDSCSSVEDETCTREQRRFHLISECCHIAPGNRIASMVSDKCLLHSMNDVECAKLYRIRECCYRNRQKVVKHLPLRVPVPLMCEGFTPSLCSMTRRLGFVRNDCCPSYQLAANETVVQNPSSCERFHAGFCSRLVRNGLEHECCIARNSVDRRA